ncbi:hypothetical protein GPECTOR_42g837 [Gonium pectorale]|uniref:Small nuclear ribonucleoprotein Prp3 C-terminal domain-containing protein n=1 Tax=Gonium pectorale TaxID=33097 RepID=A0A150G9U9_GONPE|nr:hypothetical protein GPECTOR_42g837 [Gonium pectorale]|eukprot:KXZ46626.1 hypothetical protein GPECTOR_42g837 [Gonium pectorale]
MSPVSSAAPPNSSSASAGGVLFAPIEQQTLSLAQQLCCSDGGAVLASRGAQDVGIFEGLPLLSGTISHAHDRLNVVVRAVAESQAAEGCECLLLALDALKDAVEQLAAEDADLRTEGGGATAGPGGGSAQGSAAAGGRADGKDAEPDGLLCCLVWLHHLKSLTKRKLIVQWARELRLAGACKPGFPGVIVVEGHSADVAEFLSRIRSLSWQAMQGGASGAAATGATATAACGTAAAAAAAKGDPRVEASRRLRSPLPFVELDEGGMSELGSLCKAAGLHHVFMTALKL